MTDIKKFHRKEYVPSMEIFEGTWRTIDRNLKEMGLIVKQISAKKELFPTESTDLLFYLGSCLYDFYLLVEECLLMIARIIDKWIPSSLDWHERLIAHLQNPIPEKRPPVLSAATASQLPDYLYFYMNFHRRCSSLSFSKVEKMCKNLDQLYLQLERELRTFNSFLEILQRAHRQLPSK